MTHTIKALTATYMKTEPKQSSELSSNQKNSVEAGYITQVVDWEEYDAHNDMGGHIKVTLDHGAGDRYLFIPHWHLPWMESARDKTATWPVDWTNFSAPISKYFSVGEVTLRRHNRIPTDEAVQERILKLAAALDEVRVWWGSPLRVTSWYRPPAINKAVGGVSNSQHIEGWAVDIFPVKGSVWDLQHRFEKEWYDTGRWQGGFGRGAKRGFIHCDLSHRRAWNY
ncbi:MAG: D-Ala-D-Ala carboxypeptidase family metallohydrolase [Cyanobacteria bacterium J06633_2]